MELTPRETLEVARPISWFNTVFAVAGGAFVAGGSLRAPRNLLALAYFTLPYNLTLYGINDICDYPSDRLNPRKNSVEGGLLPPETHRPMLALIAALNAPSLPLLLAAGDRRANATLTLLLATTVAYSAPPLRLKEVAGLDSFISATHYVTPFVYGLALNRATTYPTREIAAIVRSDPGYGVRPRGRLRLGRHRDRTARHRARRHGALSARRRARPDRHRRGTRQAARRGAGAPPLRGEHGALPARPTPRASEPVLAALPGPQPLDRCRVHDHPALGQDAV